MQKETKFEIKKRIKGSLGRVGVLHTPHGIINTPAFVPVGTKASVKSLTPEALKDLGSEVVLGNTYHLYLQPGDNVVKKAGGMGKFMNWHGPTVTDSGGFQVFSLGVAYGKDLSKVVKTTNPSLIIPERFDESRAPSLAKIGNDGVSFKSHLDGSLHYITPEKSIQIQQNLGADIIFAFDECTSPSEDRRYQEEALNRTHAWAKRCLIEHEKLEERKANQEKIFFYDSRSNLEIVKESNFAYAEKNTFPGLPQLLFGIVQGGRDEELRKKSADVIAKMKTVSGREFDGFGIGGSFAKEDMESAVGWVNQILPEEKPRHLLGIGEPEDLLMGIEEGVDLFDCVAPTRNARNGTLYTKDGKINMMNAKYKEDFSPVDESCNCYTCKSYTKSYVAHLFRGKEMLAGTLASIHNLYFIIHLVSGARQAILEERFFEYKEDFLNKYK